MVRFKVIKASKLLLWISIIILIAVVGFLFFQYSIQSAASHTTATFVNSEAAKTIQVFAASGDRINTSNRLTLDPASEENDIHIEIISDKDDDYDASSSYDVPRVLIYHTHSHEAYEQTSEDVYVALEAWRTKDANHSVVRVGKELAESLEKYGFEVIHDTTDHEGEDLPNAYTRSLQTLNKYREQFDLYIDIHRDAYVDGSELYHTDKNGQKKAALMMLIGNGEGFSEKPYYQENRIFAEKLTDRINAIDQGLCKDVLVKDGRYNQHIGVFSILIEVGHNRNTLAQALNSTSVLAESIYSLMIDSPDLVIEHMKATNESNKQGIS